MSEDSIDLNSPMQGGKDGYLQLFFLSRQQFGLILVNVAGTADPRILMYTRFMASSITDDTIRGQLEDELDAIEKDIESLRDNDAKSRQLFRECMRIQGDIAAFFDQFLGITHRLRVGGV